MALAPIPRVVPQVLVVQMPGYVPAPAIPIPQVPTVVAPQPVPRAQAQRPNGNPEQQTTIDELTRMLRDMRIEMVEILQGVAPAARADHPRDMGRRQCIWCDSPDHMRRDCEELAATIRDGVRTAVAIDALVAPRDAVDILPKPHVFGTQVEVSSMPARLDSDGVGSSRVSMEELQRATKVIRRAIGWGDVIDAGSLHTFLDAKKHVTWEDALVEEKRQHDVADLDNGGPNAIAPRVTRRRAGELPSEAPSSSHVPPPSPGPMEGVQNDTPAIGRGRGQRATPQEKGKAPAYKLVVDIETSTDLKTILEQRILDARIEFSLREILGIAKREFHELIIDIIKCKRQTIFEQVATQMLDVVDIAADAAHDAEVFVHEVDDTGCEYEALVAGPMLGDHDVDEEDEPTRLVLDSEFQKEHWARATGRIKIRLAKPMTAFVDHGSEINIIS
ncbi:hypothetical protein R1flu_010584 [Riccia fluitans]|uniref:CCHC-type domain-containing protein n=1 Tax=Riccia fluitans TaxID=41844 RepID=A0ABD1Z8F3_9MARC